MQLLSYFLRVCLKKHFREDNFEKENWVDEEDFCEGIQKTSDQRISVQKQTRNISLVGENQVSCEKTFPLWVKTKFPCSFSGKKREVGHNVLGTCL